jgi:hypothetical protein
MSIVFKLLLSPLLPTTMAITNVGSRACKFQGEAQGIKSVLVKDVSANQITTGTWRSTDLSMMKVRVRASSQGEKIAKPVRRTRHPQAPQYDMAEIAVRYCSASGYFFSSGFFSSEYCFNVV